MVGIEKDILILLSKIRYVTEAQLANFFGIKRSYLKRPLRRTLKKMCTEYILKKRLVNINYFGYRENSYIYYLDGSKEYQGEELLKVIIGSEIFIRMVREGYKIRRFFRNVQIDNEKYDMYIEYVDTDYNIVQILVDIEVLNKIDFSKYENLQTKVKNSTIPFIDVPNILVVSPDFSEETYLKNNYNNVNIVDFSMNKLSKYL